ncbi:MAG TPA: SRPBCC family protein [Haliangium sp.]|nr:SRPBCC family protein [Haliangium sp.]
MPASMTSELFIDAPPDRVFAAMTDADGYRHWMKGFVGVEKLTQGPFGVGTEWRETRRMFGREASEVFEVTAYEPPSRLCLRVDGTRGASRKGEYRFEYALAPEGPGTRLRLKGEIDTPGWFARLMLRMLVGMFKKAHDKEMQALKRHVEKQR